MQTLFISDLHLDPAFPASIDKFTDLLRNINSDSTDALYILGDLFEIWIGDDYIDTGYLPVIDSLSSLTKSGLPVYVMHGNRDFLLGHSFAERTAIHYLQDPCVINLYSRKTSLTHGDFLCTDDAEYQSFRDMVRDKNWQQDFLGKSIEERLGIAQQVRAISKTLNRNKPSEIMDVNEDAVNSLLNRDKSSLLIHGHTHRPGKHQMEAAERIVLGAWHDKATILKATAANLSLEEI